MIINKADQQSDINILQNRFEIQLILTWTIIYSVFQRWKT